MSNAKLNIFSDSFAIKLAALSLLILPVLAYCFHWRWRWKLRHIPGPKPSFLMGNWEFVLPEYVLQASRGWPKHYGPVMKYFLGKTPHILCTDPELVYQISVKNFSAFPDRRIPFWMVGLNKEDRERPLWEIFFARGKRWTSIRKAADPLFHANAMKAYMPIMNKAVSRFLEKMEVTRKAGPMDIVHPLKDLGLEVIGNSVFGVDFKSQGEQRIPLAHATGYLSTPDHKCKPFSLIALSFPWMKNFIGWFIGNFAMNIDMFHYGANAAGYVDGASKVLLQNSRKAKGLDPKHGQPASTETYASANWFRKIQLDSTARAFKDLKDVIPADDCLYSKLQEAELKEEGRQLTDSEIAYQGTIMVTAGHETSALTMAYAMYECALQPAVQEKIRAEVKAYDESVEPGHEFTYTDLKHFKYTRAVVEETMRKTPPVNCHLGSVRITARDTFLGGYKIPKGVPVVCNSFGMVRDEKIFPNPEVFRPERFLEDTEDGLSSRSPYAHIPFGAGPHKCIGARFATDEATLALAAFHRKYNYSLDPAHHPPGSKLDLHVGITVIPKDGIWLNIEPRQTEVKSTPSVVYE